MAIPTIPSIATEVRPLFAGRFWPALVRRVHRPRLAPGCQRSADLAPNRGRPGSEQPSAYITDGVSLLQTTNIHRTLQTKSIHF